MVMSTVQKQTLTPQQRRLADGLVKCICRGNYDKALNALDFMTGALPLAQEHSLRRVLQRLQRMNTKLDTLSAYKALINEELQLQLPQLNAGVISGMETLIPRHVLADIYDLLHSLDFDELYSQLEHIQWVEYTIIRQTLILYEHCTKLKVAQQALDRHQSMSGIRLELYVLYTLLVTIGIYLVYFFL